MGDLNYGSDFVVTHLAIIAGILVYGRLVDWHIASTPTRLIQ